MSLTQWLTAKQEERVARAAERDRNRQVEAAGRLRQQHLRAAGVRPLPSSTVYLSADGRVPVVGESHYQPALSLVAAGRAAEGVRAWCTLTPEPRNPHDRNAVRVDCLVPEGAATVGYLARELATAYQPVLMHGLPPGVVGVCAGKVFGGGDKHYGIWLDLAEPSSVIMRGQPPEGRILLEGSTQVSVTGEQKHTAVLASIFGPGPSPVRLYATLQIKQIASGKNAGQPTIEVLIDGHLVGCLSPGMTERYLPILGVQAICCEAAVAAGAEGPFQVTLRLPKVS